jgi:hypothetical protein
MSLYDDFSTATPDDKKWQVGAVPVGPDEFWFYRDDNARITCRDNRCTIDIPEYSRSHDTVGILDNPKQLFLATRSWETAGGPLTFSTTLAGTTTGNPHDYRDGFAAFNVLDFASAMVFDIITNGHQLWAIYERLLIPGVVQPHDAFTEVLDLGVATEPGREHKVAVTYDAGANRVVFQVDGRERLVREDIPVPVKQLTTGFGLLTLHPQRDGRSVSCHGQGGSGTWGAFRVER